MSDDGTNISNSRRNEVRCNYYKKGGHNIDKCFKLQRQRSVNDKSKRFAGTSQGTTLSTDFQAHMSTPNAQNQLNFTPEQYNQIMAMLNRCTLEQTQVPENHTQSSFTFIGNSLCLISYNSVTQWIIDSSATNQISPNLHFLPLISPCHNLHLSPRPMANKHKL